MELKRTDPTEGLLNVNQDVPDFKRKREKNDIMWGTRQKDWGETK